VVLAALAALAFAAGFERLLSFLEAAPRGCACMSYVSPVDGHPKDPAKLKHYISGSSVPGSSGTHSHVRDIFFEKRRIREEE
jgi:hypothetical protein